MSKYLININKIFVINIYNIFAKIVSICVCVCMCDLALIMKNYN